MRQAPKPATRQIAGRPPPLASSTPLHRLSLQQNHPVRTRLILFSSFPFLSFSSTPFRQYPGGNCCFPRPSRLSFLFSLRSFHFDSRAGPSFLQLYNNDFFFSGLFSLSLSLTTTIKLLIDHFSTENPLQAAETIIYLIHSLYPRNAQLQLHKEDPAAPPSWVSTSLLPMNPISPVSSFLHRTPPRTPFSASSGASSFTSAP